MFETIVKKIYRQPAIVSERCFETNVLGCSKSPSENCGTWGEQTDLSS